VEVELVELSRDGDIGGWFYLARNLVTILFVISISWKNGEYSLVRTYNTTGEWGREGRRMWSFYDKLTHMI